MAPTVGRVIVVGMDISLIPIDLWRDEIAYIEQSTHLFSTTILENITCKEGKEMENIEKVLEICSKVGLLELLGTLPMGLLTLVGNNGKILSGGECQKIAVARALYKDAQIYIFDEPTAHLDVESAAGIIKIIKELKEKNKHVILISHKESDLELANKIIRI
jgi:ABC-type multidrug transport system fused ATPase/permease subunit